MNILCVVLGKSKSQNHYASQTTESKYYWKILNVLSTFLEGTVLTIFTLNDKGYEVTPNSDKTNGLQL